MITIAFAATAMVPAAGVGNGQAVGAGALCSSVISSQVLTTGPNQLFAVNNIIEVSLLILLLMLNLAALMYLLGSAIKLRQLVNFGRTEIGEVFITALIVFIFLGGFQYENALPTTGNYLELAPEVVSQGIFQSDCASLASGSLTALSEDVVPLIVQMDTLQLYSNVNFGATVTYEGLVSVTPFAGLGFVLQLYGKVLPIIIVLIGLPLAGTAILAIFYAIGPLFLYLGIILRTVPFTRAAGGSFLGLFLSFYILFPLLLYLLIANVSLATLSVQTESLSQMLNSLTPGGTGNPFTAITSSFGGLVEVQAIVITVVAQLLYLVLSLILALLIAFDFMERSGDVLGSPSLASKHTLRNII